ncbi:MAG: hypothetical protein NWE89_01640 [Candidatus Bathyarchaeota archaeon]|nr:hypothetical protein [Candidatus Bathyarchaeota archaeon]
MKIKQGDKRKLRELRVSLSKEIKAMVSATEAMVKPLKTLDKRQIAAVNLFILERDALMGALMEAGKLDAGLVREFSNAVVSICPDLEPVVVGSRFADPCMDHHVAYATAMARCEEDGKSEDECDDAIGPGAAAVMCEMDQLLEIKRVMEDLWIKIPEPRPFPWPY